MIDRRSILVYVAGPYSAPTPEGIEANIAEARKAAVALKLAGFSYFCPHLNSARFERDCPGVPHEDWLRQDLLILRACHAVLMLPGWERSPGACREHKEATLSGPPVFYTLADLEAVYPKEV